MWPRGEASRLAALGMRRAPPAIIGLYRITKIARMRNDITIHFVVFLNPKPVKCNHMVIKPPDYIYTVLQGRSALYSFRASLTRFPAGTLMENETQKSQKLLNSPYWVRKLRTRHSLMDLNKDGAVSKEDFDIFADNLIRHGKLSETLGQSVRERVMRIWLSFGVPDDAKVTADEWVTNSANLSGTY